MKNRPKNQRYSLKRKVITQVIITTSILSLIICYFFATIMINWEKEEFDDELKDEFKLLSSLFEYEDDELEFEFSDKLLPEYGRKIMPNYFIAWSKEKKIIKQSKSMNYPSKKQITKRKLDNNSFSNITFSDGENARLYKKTFAPTHSTNKSEHITLEIIRNSSDLSDLIFNTIIIFLISYLAFICIISYGIIRVVNHNLKPLSLLYNEIKEIHSENLDKNLSEPALAPLEIHKVSSQFNKLLELLKTNLTREKSLSANLAHELRTPIAEIKTLSEVAINNNKLGNEPLDLYNDILESTEQMQNITNSLIALSQNEINGIKEKVNLLNIFLEFEKQFDQILAKNNITISNNIQPNIYILSQPVELKIIIKNLLSNAIQYSIKNTEITVKIIANSDNFINIEISNITSDLINDDIPLIFDRLWRKSKSRANKNNLGLGLSLVKSYSNLMGITAKANLLDGRFTIILSEFKKIK